VVKYYNLKLYNNSFFPVLSGEIAYDNFGLKARLLNI